MLCLDVGPREAARMCGIKEATVLDWCATGKWLDATRQKAPALPPPASMVSPIVPIKPADALANTLAERHGETKLGLSKWTSKTAKALGNMNGEKAMASHQVAVSAASVMGKLWPEQQEREVRISIYADQAKIEEAKVIDI